VKLGSWGSGRRAGRPSRRATAPVWPGLGLTLPLERSGSTHVYHQFTVRVPDRDAVRDACGAGGATAFTTAAAASPAAVRELGYGTGDFPEAERAAERSSACPCIRNSRMRRWMKW